jgi:hypothetical protein
VHEQAHLAQADRPYQPYQPYLQLELTDVASNKRRRNCDGAVKRSTLFETLDQVLRVVARDAPISNRNRTSLKTVTSDRTG